MSSSCRDKDGQILVPERRVYLDSDSGPTVRPEAKLLNDEELKAFMKLGYDPAKRTKKRLHMSLDVLLAQKAITKEAADLERKKIDLLDIPEG